MTCPTCDDTRVVRIVCCGPISPFRADCCCAYSGGYDAAECPDCEAPAKAPEED